MFNSDDNSILISGAVEDATYLLFEVGSFKNPTTDIAEIGTVMFEVQDENGFV